MVLSQAQEKYGIMPRLIFGEEPNDLLTSIRNMLYKAHTQLSQICHVNTIFVFIRTKKVAGNKAAANPSNKTIHHFLLTFIDNKLHQ